MNYDFTTERLIVKEWHSFEPKEVDHLDLEDIVEKMLVPEVTNTFPLMWRGKYNTKRVMAWIEERDREAKTLLAVEKETKKSVGLIHFFRGHDRSKGPYLRLGYLLSKIMWGKGFATELVEGFMHWSKENDVSTILAAVDPDNTASIRVLEKNNFLTEKMDTDGISLLFVHDYMN